NALALDIDFLVAQENEHLAGDFSGGKVALYPELRSEAELAIDGAAYLARNADGRAVPVMLVLLGDVLIGVGSVARFAAVAFGHPDGFYALAVGKADQVSNG